MEQIQCQWKLIWWRIAPVLQKWGFESRPSPTFFGLSFITAEAAVKIIDIGKISNIFGNIAELERTVIFAKNMTLRKHSLIGSLNKHDDYGNKTPTNLLIWKWKTVYLHALHVHFSSFDILKTFSFFLRREMTCFAVVWTTWAYGDKCSILSSYVPSAGSNLISA